MIKSYLQSEFRNLLKKPLYTTINLIGLSFGLACFAFIVSYISHELSYDRFHKNGSNIYRVVWHNDNPQTRTPHPLALALKNDFSEVVDAVSLSPLWGPGLTRQTFSIKNIEKNVQFDETGVLAVDSSFFKVFSFELLKGNPKTVLNRPGAILLSESMAMKYFGTDDPIGKFLSVNKDNSLIEVIGIFRDVPENSHVHFDFLVSYVHEKAGNPQSDYFTWRDFGHYNYIQLDPNADVRAFEKKLMDWLPKYIDLPPDMFQRYKANEFGLRLQPLYDIHLKSDLLWELGFNGNIEYIYMMLAAAILILTIGTINFINLTTLRSMYRTKEVGVRRCLGAFNSQIVVQFIAQTLIVACVAAGLALLLMEVSFPLLYSFVGVNGYLNWMSCGTIVSITALAIGCAAGYFSSIQLVIINPFQLLLGKFTGSVIGSGITNLLMVFQFGIVMFLMTISLIFFKQLKTLENNPLGYSKEELIVVPIKNKDLFQKSGDYLKEELLKAKGVKGATGVSNIPGKNFNQNPVYIEHYPSNQINTYELIVDYDFLDVMEVQISSGRNFLRENPADLIDGVLLNETAARQLQISDFSQTVFWDRDSEIIKINVLGIVSDFYFQSLHKQIRPLLIKLNNRNLNYMVIKVDDVNLKETLNNIESIWKRWDERFSFEFYFLDESVNHQYHKERSATSIMIFFAIITLIISCIGLLGLAGLKYELREKEISIRKVLGANTWQLIFLLVWDFTKLILIAIFLVIPVTYLVAYNWLANFQLRITLSPIYFILTALTVMILAWLTIGFLTLKTTKLNPVVSLKTS